MKNYLRPATWLGVALVLFLTSCASLFDKAVNPDLGSPDPADNPAKGTFTAKVNGKAFTAMEQGTEFEAEESSSGDFTTIGLSTIDKNYNGFSFILLLPGKMNAIAGEEIDLAGEYSSALYQSFSGNLTSLKWYSCQKGYMRFSQVTPKKIVGTFAFTAESDSGEEVEITGGTFNLYY